MLSLGAITARRILEGTIKTRMRLGDLLVRANLVSAEQVTTAIQLQAERGGRLGDYLVQMGALSQDALDAFLYRTPPEPEDIAATKIEANELVDLLLKKLLTVGWKRHVNLLIPLSFRSTSCLAWCVWP
jgi:hypothetical protein